MSQSIRSLGLLAVCLLGSVFSTSDAFCEDDAASGTVELGVPGLLNSLDPAKADQEGERVVVLNLFDQLYQYHHLKRPYALQPCLAAALPEVSDGGRTVTIKLDPSARFTDDACFADGKGRQVTAGDVVFCFLRLMDAHVKSPGTWVLDRRIVGLDAFKKASAKRPKNVRRTNYSTEQGYPLVEGLQVVDDTTLRIRLVRACPELPWLLATSYASIYPPEAVARHGDKLGRYPVSSGAYRVKSFVDNRKIILERNPSFRTATYPSEGEPDDEELGNLRDAGKPLPRNGLVVVQAYTQTNDAWNALLANQLDCAPMSRDAALASLDPSRTQLIPALQARDLRLERLPRLEISYYVFNMSDKVLGHPSGEKGLAIRQAMSLACDETWTINTWQGGLAERVYGPILPEFPEHERTWTNDWTLQPDDDREAAVELARELLAEAGFPDGKGIPTLKMHITPYPGTRSDFAEFQRNMADVGIKVEAIETPWAEMLKLMKAGQYQIMPTSWMADYPDAHNFLSLFYGPHAPDPNFSHYDDADFNELFARSLKLPADHEERESLYHRMRNKVVDDCVWIYRYRRLDYSVVQPWVRGYRSNDVAPKYFQYLWVDAKKRTEIRSK